MADNIDEESLSNPTNTQPENLHDEANDNLFLNSFNKCFFPGEE